jgi:bis(5'-nucleosidyl)-tetraphosphatase
MPDLKAAGAICYLKDGKHTLFLILRSSKNGEWGPPKGHASTGESEVETAARELYEETGVRRARFTPGFREVLHYTVEKKGKKQDKEVVYFLCELDSDDVKLSHEHNEAHLGTLDEVEQMVPHEDTKDVFRKAAKAIKKS